MGACKEEGASMRADESGLGFSSPCPSSPSFDTVQPLEGELNALGLGDVDSHETNPSAKEADLRSSGRSRHYPLRAGEPDCAFYLRTGTCRYGSNCKFNHPPRRKNRAVKDKENEKENEKEKEVLGQQETKVVEDKEMEKETENDKENEKDRSGQLACKYYLKSGGCKFGKACRYSHPQERAGEEPPELNFLGLPIRPGEKECPFYMRTGSCKFSTNCRYHHPDPTAVGGSDSHSGYQNDQNIQLHTSAISQLSSPSWTSPQVSNEPISYINASPPYATMMPSLQGVHSNLEWDGYYAPVASPSFPPERNIMPPSAMAVNNLTKDVDNPMHKTAMNEYPERPGQPDCQYFMRNGECKFRSACRYHHPKDRVSKSSACALGPNGLPLRPDQIICTHYRRYGICKFGPACKFNHPIDVASSDRPASPAAPLPAAPPSEVCSSCSWE